MEYLQSLDSASIPQIGWVLCLCSKWWCENLNEPSRGAVGPFFVQEVKRRRRGNREEEVAATSWCRSCRTENTFFSCCTGFNVSSRSPIFSCLAIQVYRVAAVCLLFSQWYLCAFVVLKLWEYLDVRSSDPRFRSLRGRTLNCALDLNCFRCKEEELKIICCIVVSLFYFIQYRSFCIYRN